MDERQILVDAKALITQKRYQEARRLLKGIAHNPTAQKWLVKLDEIAPPPANPFVADDNPFADPNDNPFWSATPATFAPRTDSSYAYLSDDEKFARVKVLLKDKNYEEARQILMTLPDNPSAQKLLTKLHQIAPSMPSGSFGSTTTTNRKSNPAISDPFGQPASNPFAASQSNPFGARSDSNPFASPQNDHPFGGSAGYEIVPTPPNESLSLLQSSGTRTISAPIGQPSRNSKKGSKGTTGAVMGAGFLGWMGRRLRARLIGGAIALIVIGITTVLGIDLNELFNKTKTYENDSFQMTYSGHWESVDPNNEGDCQDSVGACLLVLESRTSATGIRVQNLALIQGNHQTTINTLWSGYERGNVGLHMVGTPVQLKVDGQDAVQWYMTWRDPAGYDMYGLVLYVPTATSVVEIGAWSNSQSIFSGESEDVQKVIDSIKVKQPPR